MLLSAIILGAIAGLLVMIVRYNQMFSDTTSWMQHTIVVLNASEQTLASLHDYETGRLEIQSLAKEFEVLRKLTADNPAQQARIDSLIDICAHAAAALPSGRDPQRISARNYTDSLRGGILRLQTEESRLLAMRQAANNDSRTSLRTAIIALLTFVFTLLCLCSFFILHNFNRRKEAEKGLEEAEQRFATLVRHIKDYAIFRIDPAGRVMSWNRGAEQIKGYTEAEIIGQPISVFYSDEDNARGEPELNMQMAAADGSYESIGIRKRKDGSLFHADVVFTALRGGEGQLTGFVKITRDISDQIRIQEEMGHALSREKQLNEMKSRFVTLASHEFKTPLSVILSSTNLIGKYSAPEMEDKRQRHINRIKSNVNNLKQLLNDFLSLEKLEEGVIRNDPSTADLVKMAEEAVQDMEEACKEGQRIECTVTGEQRPIMVDQHLLRNILNNLLSNAIKYSPESSLIRFELEFNVDKVRFRVADSGIGIPADEQQHLFERFFRAKNTTGISGTGLGLSIVKKYLDLMGGSITVASLPGSGSAFTIALPIEPVCHDQVQPLH
ncbi:MAG TPA: ATP-binding protein [Puia sp.]|jgi:PAS domain S-box-containing protein|nr:ATP-binding protein [Puia sp.]